MKSEVREEMNLLRKVGWKRTGHTGGDHQAIEHPEFGRHTLPSTPSDHRWRKNQRRDIAKRMGLTLRELEIAMGVASPDRTNGDRPKRERNLDGVHAHKLKLAGAGQTIPEPRPKRKPEPDDPAEKSVEDVREAWERKRVRANGLDLPTRPPMVAPEVTSNIINGTPHPCRNCGATIEPTGKRGRPRVFCNDFCKAESKRPTRTLELELPRKTIRLLGDDPEATVRSLIDIYAKGKTND